MAAKKEENKEVTNSMDVFFNGWWNQVDFFEEMEQRSLEAIKSQNEWINGTREQYYKLEENSKKLTTEFTSNLQKLIEDNKVGLNTREFHDLVSKLEEIGHRSQTLAFLPGKTSLDILSTTGDQLEKTYSRAIGQQQKNRDEFAKRCEGMFEQMKETQMGVFNSFPFNQTLVKQ